MGAVVVIAVAVGGFIGAPLRFLVDRFVTDRTETDLPVGTFLINVSGSLLLGLLTGLEIRGHLPEVAKALVAVGFCGAFTTFSTWSFETVRLLEGREYLHAALNAVGGLIVGLAAAGAGMALGLLT
jgi:CrcB protein